MIKSSDDEFCIALSNISATATLTTHTHTQMWVHLHQHICHIFWREVLLKPIQSIHVLSLHASGRDLSTSLTVKLHWALSVSCPLLHSVIIPSLFSLVPFCIHYGSTCFSTSPASVYYRVFTWQNKVWKCTQWKMLMVASIYKLNTGKSLSKCYVSW